jgi:hypothetical protein
MEIRALNRTAFLVDGFNLYHSLMDASFHQGLEGAGTRRQDLRAFCGSFQHAIGGGARLAAVHYFSALAEHMEAVKPSTTARHLAYIECLRASGVEVVLSSFKQKWILCPHCKQKIVRHEEKATDVAIAAKLLELLARDECDSIVLVTGDSDIAPAMRTAKALFPAKRLYCCFPYNRQSHELRGLAEKTFKISRQCHGRHQLPNPVISPGGRRISKPDAW